MDRWGIAEEVGRGFGGASRAEVTEHLEPLKVGVVAAAGEVKRMVQKIQVGDGVART